MADAVLYEVKDQVGYLTLNLPQSMNSLSPELIKRLHYVCDELIPNSDVRAILLRGEGPSFCAGGNVKSFAQFDATGDITHEIKKGIISVEDAITKLLNIQVPVVASVHGSVAGAGVSVMLTADIIIAAENTKFTLAYTKIGLSPDGGSSYLIPRAIGQRKTLELYLTNEVFLADKALEWGLINHTAPEDQVFIKASELTQKLANGPTLSFMRAKKLIQASLNNDLDSQYALEREFFAQSFLSQDAMRGISAFIAKEEPKFEGN